MIEIYILIMQLIKANTYMGLLHCSQGFVNINNKD
jgi:hypothetical protein